MCVFGSGHGADSCRGADVCQLSGFHRLDSLAVLELNHAQGDLGVPRRLLQAPEVNLLAVCHHHGEIDISPLPLHAVHRLHVLKRQHFAFGPARLRVVDAKPLVRQHAVFPLPKLQQPVAPFLQQPFLQNILPIHLACVLQMFTANVI